MKKAEIKKLADQYRKSVRWSEEDHAFVGTVHDLVGDCCHGDDPVEVFRECEEIAFECVNAALQIGKELPAPGKDSPTLSSIDPAVVRKELGMSQVKFARFLGVSPKTLHKWEQKTSKPSGAARSLLKLAATKPKVVMSVLG